ncbi:MAG: hypothetical protein HC866_04380 [Leptolyngbyaceae cyanobacterium RU_5_1]|nr:hypothetical protein [Leptolyngbyaceae cyanobacterium RU_5_1]
MHSFFSVSLVFAATLSVVQVAVSEVKTEQGKCSDWLAWTERIPGQQPTLYVTGKCTFPTDGYSVWLERVKPQKSNSVNLVLNRVIDTPAGRASAIESEEEVKYGEDTSFGFAYESVTILPDGVKIPVK